VDDLWLPSVRVLTDFLRGEAEWELLRELPYTVFFRKVRQVDQTRDWERQRMNYADADKWSRGGRRPLGRRLLNRVRRLLGSAG
jgi:hypothetical protein